MDQLKRDDNEGLLRSNEQKLHENSNIEDRLPEFDVNGTPLNAI